MQQYTYLLVNVGCIIVPLVCSFHSKILFYRQWKFFIIPCLATALFFIIWDSIFTHYAIWYFNKKYITGIYIYNLPLEEVLFFICIPYACVFTYYCIAKFANTSSYQKAAVFLSFILLIGLTAVAILNIYKLYTSVTFILLSILICTLLLCKAKFLSTFFITYLLVLIPFTLSNGILTGSFWISEPVVLYNNTQNVGIRMFNIPIEDIFYGMLLFIMNVSGFEWMRSKKMT